ANSFQLYSGRPVGCCMETMTNLPFTLGSQAWNSTESLTFGRTTTSPSTGLPPVVGLHASWVPYKVLTRGWMRSICEIPRSQPRHSPNCWLLALIPHFLKVFTAQSLAFCICGVPT